MGLSQGSVSELLSKPKPWHMLSIKGREPFIRMQLWLSDPHNIEKLQTLKNERREANKRRRTNGDEGRTPRDSPLYNFSNNSGGYSPLSGTMAFGQQNPSSGSYGASGAKKPRILFSEEQKEALKLAFSMDPYPSTATIEFLANELGLSLRTITNWFHNHRMRLKQVSSSSDEANPISTMSLPFGMSRDSGVTFDPAHFRMSLTQRLLDLRSREVSQGSDRSKYSSLYGSPPSTGGYDRNANSCSSSDTSMDGDDDMATLDLSMSNRIKKSNPSLMGDSENSCDSDGFDDSRSCPVVESMPTIDVNRKVVTGSSRRKPQVVTSSSSRRKTAQPKWVDPGLEFSGDDEDDLNDHVIRDNTDDVTDDESRDSDVARREIINGVCIRQTDTGSKGKVTTTESEGRKSGKDEKDDEEDWDQESGSVENRRQTLKQGADD